MANEAEFQAKSLIGVLLVGIVREEGFRVSENGGESKLRIVEGFFCCFKAFFHVVVFMNQGLEAK